MDERLAPEQHDTLPDIPEPAETPSCIGHDDIATLLAGAYRSGHLHHALLFSGPTGIGKATLAFQFARHLLAFPDFETAPAHLEIADTDSTLFRQIAIGAHPGVLHLTRPAADKGKGFKTVLTVNEVRRVNGFLARTSHDGGYRVIIVDTADDMNANAANALLKNLEEPPKRTVFVLISHAAGRLLPTLRSRCLALPLRSLPEETLATVLQRLEVQLPSDPAALAKLFAMAEGSVRNAILLTQHGGMEIAEAVDTVLEAAQFDLSAAAKIASVVSARDAGIPLQLFKRHLVGRIEDSARKAAHSGQLARAAELSTFHGDATATMRDTEIYNLDKHQSVMDILRRANAVLHGRG